MTPIFFSLVSSENVLHVVTEGHSTKDKGENDSHKADINQLRYFESNSLKDVANFRVVTKDIHNMNEIERWMEEGSNERDDDINCYSPKLGTKIKRLSCLPSLEYFMELGYFLVYSLLLEEIIDLCPSLYNKTLLLLPITLRYRLLGLNPCFSLRIFPYFKLEPIIGIDQSHRELNQTYSKSDESSSPWSLEICFLIVDYDIVVHHHEDTDSNRHEG